MARRTGRRSFEGLASPNCLRNHCFQERRDIFLFLFFQVENERKLPATDTTLMALRLAPNEIFTAKKIGGGL
jgi:hypothetical protein